MIEPRVSVVMPARNAQVWIGAALGSVLSQTCAPSAFEVIVVDDGSTDRTAAVARDALAGSGVACQVIASPGAAGPSAARNLGWRRARAPWIQFLDADDLLASSKVARQLAVAEAAAEDVALVFSAWGRVIERRGTWVRDAASVRPVIGADPVRDVLSPHNFIATGSQIFRRAWLDRTAGFVEAHALIEDVELLLRIAMAGGRLVEAPSDEPLFWYRRHAGSASRQNRLAFAHASRRNTQTAERWWRSTGALTPARARFLADLYSGAARVFAEHDPAAFDETIAHLERLCPGFLPQEPAGLRQLSRFIGYGRAEAWSVWYRRVKRRVVTGQAPG